jgi:hypothetical protein
LSAESNAQIQEDVVHCQTIRTGFISGPRDDNSVEGRRDGLSCIIDYKASAKACELIRALIGSTSTVDVGPFRSAQIRECEQSSSLGPVGS